MIRVTFEVGDQVFIAFITPLITMRTVDKILTDFQSRTIVVFAIRRL